MQDTNLMHALWLSAIADKCKVNITTAILERRLSILSMRSIEECSKATESIALYNIMPVTWYWKSWLRLRKSYINEFTY